VPPATPDGLQLGLEEVLVDLSLVDRHAFLDAEPDDRSRSMLSSFASSSGVR
jgi:hypothetical protein